MGYRAHYIITSERASRRSDEYRNDRFRRSDEYRNDLFSNRILNVGDTIILNGLKWTVDKIVSDMDREV